MGTNQPRKWKLTVPKTIKKMLVRPPMTNFPFSSCPQSLPASGSFPMSQLFAWGVYIYIYKGFPGGASGNKPSYQCRRHKSCAFDPWVGKIPWRRGHGNPLHYFCLENPMDREAWWATVHGVTQSWTHWLKWLSTYIFTNVYVCVYIYVCVCSFDIYFRGTRYLKR